MSPVASPQPPENAELVALIAGLANDGNPQILAVLQECVDRLNEAGRLLAALCTPQPAPPAAECTAGWPVADCALPNCTDRCWFAVAGAAPEPAPQPAPPECGGFCAGPCDACWGGAAPELIPDRPAALVIIDGTDVHGWPVGTTLHPIRFSATGLPIVTTKGRFDGLPVTLDVGWWKPAESAGAPSPDPAQLVREDRAHLSLVDLVASALTDVFETTGGGASTDDEAMAVAEAIEAAGYVRATEADRP